MSEFKFEESILYQIVKTGRKLVHRINSRFTQTGSDLTTHQAAMLQFISIKQGEVIQNELAELTDKDKSAVLRMLDILERKGYVTRNADPNDRRKNVIEVTDKANAVIKILNQLEQEEIENVVKGISAEEMATCRKVLLEIQKNA